MPWAVSCGTCPECRAGLTAKCATFLPTSPGRTLSCFGFGPASGAWGGMIADSLRIPFAEHMLVKVPEGLDLRVPAASDNLTDAWRAVAPPLFARQSHTVNRVVARSNTVLGGVRNRPSGEVAFMDVGKS